MDTHKKEQLIVDTHLSPEPEVAALFPHATRDEQGRLTQVRD
jgi:hypothetical protein